MLERLGICYTHPSLSERAATLAQQLNLPFANQQHAYRLTLTPEALQLHDMRPGVVGPLYVDFTNGKNAHRRSYGGGRQQTLARAVGMHKHSGLHIIDATAGLGRDSFVFATLGARVTLLERVVVIAALLEDGLQRAALHHATAAIAKNMQLLTVDARLHLEQLLPPHYPDVIYMDPMYPHRDKSALVKKEMRITREFAGDDQDAAALLSIALKRCKKRVAVKRPKRAPSLNEINPDAQIHGKTTRYDIYFSHT